MEYCGIKGLFSIRGVVLTNDVAKRPHGLLTHVLVRGQEQAQEHGHSICGETGSAHHQFIITVRETGSVQQLFIIARDREQMEPSLSPQKDKERIPPSLSLKRGTKYIPQPSLSLQRGSIYNPHCHYRRLRIYCAHHHRTILQTGRAYAPAQSLPHFPEKGHIPLLSLRMGEYTRTHHTITIYRQSGQSQFSISELGGENNTASRGQCRVSGGSEVRYVLHCTTAWVCSEVPEAMLVRAQAASN